MKRNLELPILHNALNAFTAHWPYYSRNSSVTTVLRLQDGQQECEYSIPGRFLYSTASTPALRLQPDFYPMRTKFLSKQIKRSRRETYHSPTYNAEVRMSEADINSLVLSKRGD